MKQIIYLKYGELILKGKNKKDFINLLFKNVNHALNKYHEIKIQKFHDSIILENITKTQISKIINIIQRISGISWIIQGQKCVRDLELVSNTIIKTIKNEQINIDQFKIVTSRQDKTFPINSMDFSKLVGANILKAFNNAKVDVKKPLTKINIEIKQKYIVIYYKKIKGMGGFPLGINGRALMMLSGGIDSPIASYLLLKKGMNVDFVTFISPPHTNPQVLKKVQKIIEVLSLKKTIYSPRLFVVNFTNLQHEISHIKNKSYQITIMRRYFFRIANEILQKYHYDVLATGESIGQVASQTIDSMFTISSVLNDTLILRPLLTFDKEEIINLSRQIGTYEISILPFEDTCSLFVPANPVTKPKKKIALELEQQLELIDHIYQSTLQKNIEIID